MPHSASINVVILHCLTIARLRVKSPFLPSVIIEMHTKCAIRRLSVLTSALYGDMWRYVAMQFRAKLLRKCAQLLKSFSPGKLRVVGHYEY